MIEALNTAMLELQSALNARFLYPTSHPHIHKGEEHARRLLQEVMKEEPELHLFALGERVIHEGRTLPGSANLTQLLFRRFRERGVDRITFRRGLEEQELRQLLDVLAEETAAAKIKPSAHIGLGFIQESQQTVPEFAAVPLRGQNPLPSQLSTILGDTWKDVQERRGVNNDLLGDVIVSLSKTLVESSDAVLPLADVKKHDEYTFIHTLNVAMLSTALAQAVGFKDRMTHELNMAALLHDVGKQLIPLELLNKQGKFTDEEFARVQQHPADGARMLLATPGVCELAPIVAYEHHVRADGTGYPRVPPGWKLNLASRIVQVADVFDALRTNRPYRPAMPLPKIMQIMKADVGVLFDADLLDVFFRRIVTRGVPETPAPPPELVDV